MTRFDVALDPPEAERLAGSDPRWWFTHMAFANAESPRHPAFRKLEEITNLKRELLLPWIQKVVPGKSVLDTFCANGAFSFDAAEAVASRVVGVDFDPPRIHAGNLVSELLRNHGWPVVPEFRVADIYRLEEVVTEPFEVTFCLGGLYHVADPIYVLRKVRAATAGGGTLVMQTSGIIWKKGHHSVFQLRKQDRTGMGLTSIKAGAGVWTFTPAQVDRFLECAGFEVLERATATRALRKGYPWYCTLARAVPA